MQKQAEARQIRIVSFSNNQSPTHIGMQLQNRNESLSEAASPAQSPELCLSRQQSSSNSDSSELSSPASSIGRMEKTKSVILKVITERANEDENENREQKASIREDLDSDEYSRVKSSNIKAYKKVYKRCRAVMKKQQKLIKNGSN